MSLASDNLDKLAPAWVAAQAQLGHAFKGSIGQVGQARVKYADLQGYIDTAKPILAAHGLSFLQQSTPIQGGVIVTTLLLHDSGQWINGGGLQVPAAQNNAQQVGSAATYARRYSLAMFLGMASDDDDGHAASTHSPPAATQAPQPTAVADKPLTSAERGPLLELALAAGHTQTAASKTVAKLTRSQVPAFRKAMEAKA